MKKLILMMMFAAVLLVFVPGCGLVGYDTRTKGAYETEELVVKWERHGGQLTTDASELVIDIVNDPNGMLRFWYSAGVTKATGTGHDPAETTLAWAELVEALPPETFAQVFAVFARRTIDPNN